MKSYLIGVVMVSMGMIGVASAGGGRHASAPASQVVTMDDDKSDDGDKGDDADAPKANVLFRATGEHQCQSRSSIGHKCEVSGNRFHDCKDAYFSLKNEDCCGSTEGGGTSIDFKMGVCSPI